MGGRRREEALRDRVPEEVGDAEGEKRAPMAVWPAGGGIVGVRHGGERRRDGGVPDAGAVRRLEKVIHLLARHRPSLFSI
jgi:hypothetical protein